VNTIELKIKEGLRERSILEVNGSHEASKFIAKLFIDFTHMTSHKTSIHSGDSVRLYHKESEGYLTSNEIDISL